MTQEDKVVIERKVKWRLDELQAMAEKYGIDNISIQISVDSIDVRFYRDDFETLLCSMSKYIGDDEDLQDIYVEEWLTEWGKEEKK